MCRYLGIFAEDLQNEVMQNEVMQNQVMQNGAMQNEFPNARVVDVLGE